MHRSRTRKPRSRFFGAALADPSSNDDLKSYDMVWLLHLVGDVHQPLHATSRFTAADPEGDAGGNAVKVHCNVGNCHGANELHAYWDNLLGPSDGNPQAAAAAAKQLDAPDASRAAIADEAVWVQESFELAKRTAYDPHGVGKGNGPFQPPEKYQETAEKVAKERVALAGARLANLLNTALKSQRIAARSDSRPRAKSRPWQQGKLGFLGPRNRLRSRIRVQKFRRRLGRSPYFAPPNASRLSISSRPLHAADLSPDGHPLGIVTIGCRQPRLQHPVRIEHHGRSHQTSAGLA